MAEPVGHHGAVEFHALALVNRRLPVQRQVIAKFRSRRCAQEALVPPCRAGWAAAASGPGPWSRRSGRNKPAARGTRQRTGRGMYSRTLVLSSPTLRRLEPPQVGQVPSGSCTCVVCGRCAGKLRRGSFGLRPDFRSPDLPGVSPLGLLRCFRRRLALSLRRLQFFEPEFKRKRALRAALSGAKLRAMLTAHNHVDKDVRRHAAGGDFDG